MKKQFLFLILFVAAFVAGTSNVFAQNYDVALANALSNCLTPTSLDCDSASALHPAPGESYTYTITSADFANSGNEKVHWFVINYNDFTTDSIVNSFNDIAHLATGIVGGGYIDDASGADPYLLTADGAYNVPFTSGTPNTSDAVTLSWKYFDGQANVVLLVAYVQDAANCTDNIEVYRIIPEPAFTLDIAAIDQTDNSFHADTAAPASECVSPIESAWYVAAANPAQPGDGTLHVDYGENWVYFIVNAANFVDSWDPTFQFAYDGAGTIVSSDWTYFNSATNVASSAWHTIDVTTGATDFVVGGGGAAAADGTSLNAQGDGTAVGAAGECIVVRVRVDHGTDAENIVTRRVTVRVNGIMYDGSLAAGSEYTNTALADFGPDGGDADTLCDQVDFDDISYFDITPRPDVNEVDPTPFEQKTGEDQQQYDTCFFIT